MKTKVDFTCLALSSNGEVPVYGRFQYDYRGSMLWSEGYHCKTTGEGSPVAGGKLFAAENWNRKMHILHGENVKYDAPEGWGWCSLRMNHYYMGGKNTNGIDFVGWNNATPFWQEQKYVYGAEDYILDFEFLNLNTQEIVKLNIPKFKKHYPCHGYRGRSYCTDGSYWNSVDISVDNFKWANIVEQVMKDLGCQYRDRDYFV